MSEKLTGDFRKFMDKSFLGAWDLDEGKDTILTIDHVQGYKPMICNTTNAKAISQAHGSTKVEDWEKKKIALYKATINAFGQTTECIRVRTYAPKTDEIYCEVCGELVTDTTVDGKTYKAKAIANNALTKFGKYMCYDCAAAAKAEQEETDG